MTRKTLCTQTLVKWPGMYVVFLVLPWYDNSATVGSYTLVQTLYFFYLVFTKELQGLCKFTTRATRAKTRPLWGCYDETTMGKQGRSDAEIRVRFPLVVNTFATAPVTDWITNVTVLTSPRRKYTQDHIINIFISTRNAGDSQLDTYYHWFQPSVALCHEHLHSFPQQPGKSLSRLLWGTKQQASKSQDTITKRKNYHVSKMNQVVARRFCHHRRTPP